MFVGVMPVERRVALVAEVAAREEENPWLGGPTASPLLASEHRGAQREESCGHRRRHSNCGLSAWCGGHSSPAPVTR